MDPSIKGDLALEMAIDDASPDNGGSRRPGNLWTVEAREDMFRRREAGETWETICQDYPKRSRHAMQQQYSMMKKQRALAAGTWKSNRRGRKRKNLSPERWAPGNRNGNLDGHDEDLTEADDLSDIDPIGDEPDAKESLPHLPSLVEDPNASGRPNGLARSITDPPPRTARPRSGPNGSRFSLASVPDPPPRQSPSIKVQGSFSEGSPIGGSIPGKRRKTSPERVPEAKPPMSVPPVETPPPNFVLPSVVFEHAEFLAFLQKGIDQAQQAAKGFEAEKTAMRQNFEASVARANRRVHDAQERLRWSQYENGEKVKARDSELNEKLKVRVRDHLEEKEAMRKEFEREKKHVEEIQVKNIESLTRQNELLRRDFEAERRQWELRTQDHKREISRLRSEQAPKTTPKIRDIVDGPPATAETRNARSDAKDDFGATEDSTDKTNVPAWKVTQQNQMDTFAKLVADIETLSSSITRMNKDTETSSLKRILSDISRIDEESLVVVNSKERAAQALKALHTEAENLLRSQSTDNSPYPDGDSTSKANGK